MYRSNIWEKITASMSVKFCSVRSMRSIITSLVVTASNNWQWLKLLSTNYPFMCLIHFGKHCSHVAGDAQNNQSSDDAKQNQKGKYSLSMLSVKSSKLLSKGEIINEDIPELNVFWHLNFLASGPSPSHTHSVSFCHATVIFICCLQLGGNVKSNLIQFSCWSAYYLMHPFMLCYLLTPWHHAGECQFTWRASDLATYALQLLLGPWWDRDWKVMMMCWERL